MHEPQELPTFDPTRANRMAETLLDIPYDPVLAAEIGRMAHHNKVKFDAEKAIRAAMMLRKGK